MKSKQFDTLTENHEIATCDSSLSISDKRAVFGRIKAVLVFCAVAGVVLIHSSCALHKKTDDNAFVNGEILHTTPAWQKKIEESFPAMGLMDPGGKKLAAQLQSKAKKYGRGSDKLIAIEIKFIESSQGDAPTENTGEKHRILSKSELNTHLRKVMRDSSTQTVSYPRMVTLDGRPLSVRSVVNQPIVGPSQSQQRKSEEATAKPDIWYAPVGTMLLVCPVLTASGRIHIASDFTLSRIIGEEKHEGNPYPVVSAWRATSSLNLDDGESVIFPGPVEKSGRKTHVLLSAHKIPFKNEKGYDAVVIR